MRKISVTTVFDAPAGTLCRLLQRPETPTLLACPLLIFRPIGGPLPEVWTEGDYK